MCTYRPHIRREVQGVLERVGIIVYRDALVDHDYHLGWRAAFCGFQEPAGGVVEVGDEQVARVCHASAICLYERGRREGGREGGGRGRRERKEGGGRRGRIKGREAKL